VERPAPGRRTPADTEGGAVSTEDAETWVCPWDICDHRQAQDCRALRSHDGCGGRFPKRMTPEQAKHEVNNPKPLPVYAPNPPGHRPGAFVPPTLTEERVREIVREEIAKHSGIQQAVRSTMTFGGPPR
jgi:hypothetical protein